LTDKDLRYVGRVRPRGRDADFTVSMRAIELDIRLQVSLQSAHARAAKRAPTRISETTFAHQYRSIAQMLAHHTSGGCEMNIGNLLVAGTSPGRGKPKRVR